jgi:hypothetical protein
MEMTEGDPSYHLLLSCRGQGSRPPAPRVERARPFSDEFLAFWA